LDEVLGAHAEVRIATNDLPQHTRITLQGIVRDWNTEDQARLLHGKLVQLQSLRLRISPELAPLLDEYRLTIAQYLNRRSLADADSYARNQGAQRHAALETISQLDALDVLRQRVRTAAR
jgi:hypothetical protein